jgi:tripartite-type tricarboxylate transporter receptor subunit TctC
MSGRTAFGFAASIAAALLVAAPARAADNWPSRPIHIVVPEALSTLSRAQ